MNDEPSITTVIAVFQSREQLRDALDLLRDEGFPNSDVSALLFPPDPSPVGSADGRETNAPEGATSGTVAGIAVGGTLGWLAGAGALVVPGVGALLAAGPIAGLLAGAGVGGVVGGLTGALIGLGIPEDDAAHYEDRIRDGGILLSISCPNEDRRDAAEAILRKTRAQEISASTESPAESETIRRIRGEARH